MPKGIYVRKKKPQPPVTEAEQAVKKEVAAVNDVAWDPVPKVESIVIEQAEEPQPWTPQPVVDGDILPTNETQTSCANPHCKHGKETHYGPSTDWCNVHACKCTRFHLVNE